MRLRRRPLLLVALLMSAVYYGIFGFVNAPAAEATAAAEAVAMGGATPEAGLHASDPAAHEDSAAGTAHAAEEQIIPFMLAIVVILMAAKLGGEIFERAGQPAVLGELLFGVALGNLHLLGIDALEPLKNSAGVAMAAQIGVIILLFEVGLEERVQELLSVGVSSLLVAVIGVAVPMALGYGVGVTMLPEAPPLLHLFLGATLAATSVGITARVLKDLGKTHTKEARIVLGAAVIDDVLGLIVLAVVTGLISAANAGQQGMSLGAIGIILLKAVGFLVGALVVGTLVARPIMILMSHLRVRGVMLAASISICFFLAAVAGLLGLAPIVGAFAAGLILEPSHFVPFVSRGERPVEQLIEPISDLFVPVFFVLMGFNVDLLNFVQVEVLGLAAALTAAAVLGKVVCGIGALGKGIRRMIISVGMIPRGEVGLIFASIGASMVLNGERVVAGPTYSAVVVMVIVTTLITPLWLKLLFREPAQH